MNRDSKSASLRAALLLGLVCAAAAGSTGCVYRPNIQQGNLLDIEDVDQVQTGMTRSQVRYLLGTPMLADPFDPQRWDYIYTFRRGHERKVERSHFIVHFDGDRVSKVDRLDLPDDVTAHRKKQKKDMEEPREPPTLPSITQPQPDAPRPGGNDRG
jgi:outer membrane protein assembly factor BamE